MEFRLLKTRTSTPFALSPVLFQQVFDQYYAKIMVFVQSSGTSKLLAIGVRAQMASFIPS